MRFRACGSRRITIRRSVYCSAQDVNYAIMGVVDIVKEHRRGPTRPMIRPGQVAKRIHAHLSYRREQSSEPRVPSIGRRRSPRGGREGNDANAVLGFSKEARQTLRFSEEAGMVLH